MVLLDKDMKVVLVTAQNQALINAKVVEVEALLKQGQLEHHQRQQMVVMVLVHLLLVVV